MTAQRLILRTHSYAINNNATTNYLRRTGRVQIFIVWMAKYVLFECQEFIIVGLPVDLRGIDAVADMYFSFNRLEQVKYDAMRPHQNVRTSPDGKHRGGYDVRMIGQCLNWAADRGASLSSRVGCNTSSSTVVSLRWSQAQSQIYHLYPLSWIELISEWNGPALALATRSHEPDQIILPTMI
ncbi:hypothetical protein K503DRAFT_787519 [Rhizopogon vinicolor AM-OR11-026]|uniref:Uncharacterized protein n=1 Tax=Rhizopogon vinicolor AM-OR11-026 TaxID=1314800 RepID=A0A1B7MH85_9AGAM|nr:hypothetical protein K503DRAFT_787519 [Rhizopogon vinicolor AM-OR11-026]